MNRRKKHGWNNNISGIFEPIENGLFEIINESFS